MPLSCIILSSSSGKELSRKPSVWALTLNHASSHMTTRRSPINTTTEELDPSLSPHNVICFFQATGESKHHPIVLFDTTKITTMQHQQQQNYDEAMKPQNPPDATYIQVEAVQPPHGENAFMNEIQTGEWATGVFNCLDFLVPNCVMAWCCPCVTLAQIAHRLRMATYSNALIFFFCLAVGMHITYSFPSYGMYGIVYDLGSILCLACWVVQTYAIVQIRQQIRRRFQIPGDDVGDWLLSCCCGCCVAAQMATHVKSYRPGDCSFDAPDQLPAYQ